MEEKTEKRFDWIRKGMEENGKKSKTALNEHGFLSVAHIMALGAEVGYLTGVVKVLMKEIEGE